VRGHRHEARKRSFLRLYPLPGAVDAVVGADDTLEIVLGAEHPDVESAASTMLANRACTEALCRQDLFASPMLRCDRPGNPQRGSLTLAWISAIARLASAYGSAHRTYAPGCQADISCQQHTAFAGVATATTAFAG